MSSKDTCLTLFFWAVLLSVTKLLGNFQYNKILLCQLQTESSPVIRVLLEAANSVMYHIRSAVFFNKVSDMAKLLAALMFFSV